MRRSSSSVCRRAPGRASSSPSRSNRRKRVTVRGVSGQHRNIAVRPLGDRVLRLASGQHPGPVADPLDVVTRGAQNGRGTAPHTGRRAEPSRARGLYERRFTAFVADEASGVDQARANVVRFQPGVALQHELRRVAGGQHAKHMLDGEPAVSDDRLAAEDGRVRSSATPMSWAWSITQNRSPRRRRSASRGPFGGRGDVHLHIPRHPNLASSLADLDELRSARRRMPFQPPSFGPLVRRVVMVDVAEQEAGSGPVDDEPDVATDPHGPEVLVLRPVDSSCRRLVCEYEVLAVGGVLIAGPMRPVFP